MGLYAKGHATVGYTPAAAPEPSRSLRLAALVYGGCVVLRHAQTLQAQRASRGHAKSSASTDSVSTKLRGKPWGWKE